MNRIIVLSLGAVLICSSCVNSTQQKYPPIDFDFPRIDLSSYEEQKKRPYQDKTLALAVAISGGGHRAANFGVGVLVALEEEGLLHEVDYLSTVSGGGFAAAAYIETLIYHLDERKKNHRDYKLKTWLEKPEEVDITDPDDYLKRHLERGYETSLFWGFLNPKTWFSNIDRGDFLEKKIDSRILGYNKRGRSLLLNDVFRDKEQADCDGEECRKMVPYWVANAAIFQNGAIFPFIPNIIEHYNVIEYTHRAKIEVLGEDKGNIPLAVGVKASASFPVVFPATTLKCSRKSADAADSNAFIHLLDGGLADNLGVITAIDILREDPSPRKVLLVIDAYKDDPQPYSHKKGSPTAVQVALRIMGIGLDSNHTRIEDQVETLCAKDGIKPVFLSFESLKREDEDEIVKKVSQAKAETAQSEAEMLKAKSILYENARDVNTSFNITEDEQALLFQAGEKVVDNEMRKIKDAIENNQTSN